jgi:signal transduction histidine kinase
MAQSLSAAWRRDPVDGERRAARMGDLAQMAFAEMRALLRELMPGEALSGVPQGAAPPHVLAGALLTHHGLATAVTRLLPVMVPGNLVLRLDVAGYRPQAEPLERTLLRVCQEAVSNVVRHAEARRVKVSVTVDAGRVYLRVADDGRGLDPGAPRGLGIASMEHRLAELGGSLHIRPGRPRGTVVLASVPRRDA